MRLVLSTEAEHDEARELSWWVVTDVGEVGVQGYKGSVLLPADGGKILVGYAAEVFLQDGRGSIASVAKRVSDLNRQILVDLESHR